MTSTSAGTLEGTLSKWTNVMKGWQYRFFVLDENAGLLSYYTVSDQHTWLSDGKFCCFFFINLKAGATHESVILSVDCVSSFQSINQIADISNYT